MIVKRWIKKLEDDHGIEYLSEIASDIMEVGMRLKTEIGEAIEKHKVGDEDDEAWDKHIMPIYDEYERKAWKRLKGAMIHLASDYTLTEAIKETLEAGDNLEN